MAWKPGLPGKSLLPSGAAAGTADRRLVKVGCGCQLPVESQCRVLRYHLPPPGSALGSPPLRWMRPCSDMQGKLALAAATVLAVLLFARYEQTLGLAGSLWGSSGRARLVAFDEVRTLQFDVCNGFTNQRIALMSGEQASHPA